MKIKPIKITLLTVINIKIVVFFQNIRGIKVFVYSILFMSISSDVSGVGMTGGKYHYSLAVSVCEEVHRKQQKDYCVLQLFLNS